MMNAHLVPAALELLEPRTLFSTAPLTAVAHPARASLAAVRNYVVGFYGLGGTSFGNAWLAQLVTDTGADEGATTKIYQQTQGQLAVTDFFAFVDANHDHVLTTAEIANVSVQAIGYSYGGIQASEFTRALTATSRRGLYGYRLAAAVPVDELFTIDPVNTTPEKHTDGPLSNVQVFNSYYQTNALGSSIALTIRGKSSSGGTATFGGTNPIGGLLPSAARATNQVDVDTGTLADTIVTQYYSRRDYGTLAGADTNHLTMPWFIYKFGLIALTAP